MTRRHQHRPWRGPALDAALARETHVRAIIEAELVVDAPPEADSRGPLQAASPVEIDRLVAICVRAGWNDVGIRAYLRRVAQADGDAAWARALKARDRRAGADPKGTSATKEPAHVPAHH